MIKIRQLILSLHRRKKHIVGLFISLVCIYATGPIVNSISLGEGKIAAQIVQNQLIEIIGLLFLIYFGATTLIEFKKSKITQLLRSKRKSAFEYIGQIRGGLYTIYLGYIIIGIVGSMIFFGAETTSFSHIINLSISGAIILSITMILGLLTNPYMAIIGSLVRYIMSYSINFILFSTPPSFQKLISYKALELLQYLFPRLDILYSTSGIERIRAIGGNILYAIVIYTILYKTFLSFYHKP